MIEVIFDKIFNQTKQQVKGKFYTFNQNNSGGSFNYDEQSGIAHYVIVEAHDLKHAVSRAEDIGLYFDGVAKGRDCECCGDRWYKPWSDDGSNEPEGYGEHPSKRKSQKETAIHYLDGRIEWY